MHPGYRLPHRTDRPVAPLGADQTAQVSLQLLAGIERVLRIERGCGKQGEDVLLVGRAGTCSRRREAFNCEAL